MNLTIYNKSNEVALTLDINDESHRYHMLCGDDYVQLEFDSPERITIDMYSYIIIDRARYTLFLPMAVTCVNSRNYHYEARFDGMVSWLKMYRFRNPVDNRQKFALTAKPEEHLQMLVDNLAAFDAGWSAGACVSGAEQVISYDYLSCYEALELMAQTFGTEWEIVGSTISLHKVSYNKSRPVALAYGKGKGFTSGVSRNNFGDSLPITAVYPQGGDRNIDPTKYGSNTLLLPKGVRIAYDGEYFEDEPLYNAELGVDYTANIHGTAVTRLASLLEPLNEQVEGTLDCTEIYPQREGVVTDFILRGSPSTAYNYYDIVDDTIPLSLNYEDYRIAGESMVMVFQSGKLAGKEFVVNAYIHNSLNDDYPSRRFELVSQEYDGVMMPSVDFEPAVGDKYAIFGIAMPDSYIQDNATMGGASWDMMRKCVRHLAENGTPHYLFSGQLDPIYVRVADIGSSLKVGAWVSFTNDNFQPEPMLMRIVGIKRYINNPNMVDVDLSERAYKPSTRVQALMSNAKVNASIIAEANNAKRDSQELKILINQVSNAQLERKVGILIGDDHEKSVRTIAQEVAAENIPTQVATATQKMTITSSPSKNAYIANVVYEWQSSPTTVTIQSLSASDASYDNVWVIRFGCTADTKLLITPSVYWKDGVRPSFGTWGICELTFKKDSSTGIYLGEWKIYA